MTSRRLVWILVAVLGTPVALYGLAWVYFVIPSSDDYRHRLVFEGKAGETSPPSWRRLSDTSVHVNSLMDCGLLDGRTRPGVVESLGPTDETSKWRDWDSAYCLGPERKG